MRVPQTVPPPPPQVWGWTRACCLVLSCSEGVGVAYVCNVWSVAWAARCHGLVQTRRPVFPNCCLLNQNPPHVRTRAWGGGGGYQGSLSSVRCGGTESWEAPAASRVRLGMIRLLPIRRRSSIEIEIALVSSQGCP